MTDYRLFSTFSMIKNQDRERVTRLEQKANLVKD
jgi:hypothetical protein